MWTYPGKSSWRHDILALQLKNFLKKGISLRKKFCFVKEDERGQTVNLSRFFCAASRSHKKPQENVFEKMYSAVNRVLKEHLCLIWVGRG